MKRWWQAGPAFVLTASLVAAEEAPKAFEWTPPKTGAAIFTRELGMMDGEREDYATNLAVYAANRVSAAKASQASLEEARRLLGLALQLSPRNRKALVVTFQLGKGLLPEAAQGDYSPQVLARLLFTRGQLLDKQGGAENTQVARLFVELAAAMDPRNEDAVYSAETQRLDHGAIDWSKVTDAEAPRKPAPAAPERTP